MIDKNGFIKNIDKIIQRVEEDETTFYFFVVDSKNVPNGSMKYIYQLAYELHTCGHKVTMLYQLPDEYSEEEMEEIIRKELPIDDNKRYVGVGEWMGEKYMKDLPHLNIGKYEWKVGAADFLFIPEALSTLMFETFKQKLPCKRCIVVHNYNYIMNSIPLGVQWSNYGIYDAVCITENEAELVKSIFPYVNTRVLNPYIEDCFRPAIEPRKLIVNIIAREQEDVKRIVKPFYWKYGSLFQSLSFRDVRGFPTSKYASMLMEAPITVWDDPETPFGSSALEVLRCGGILIARIPKHVPEWALNEKGELIDYVLWYDDINKVQEYIASSVHAWINDDIPSLLLEGSTKSAESYRYKDWKGKVAEFVSNIKSDYIKELEAAKEISSNKEES